MAGEFIPFGFCSGAITGGRFDVADRSRFSPWSHIFDSTNLDVTRTGGFGQFPECFAYRRCLPVARPTASQKRVAEAKEAFRMSVTEKPVSEEDSSPNGLYVTMILAFLAGLTTGGSSLKNNRLGRLLLSAALDWVNPTI